MHFKFGLVCPVLIDFIDLRSFLFCLINSLKFKQNVFNFLRLYKVLNWLIDILMRNLIRSS